MRYFPCCYIELIPLSFGVQIKKENKKSIESKGNNYNTQKISNI